MSGRLVLDAVSIALRGEVLIDRMSLAVEPGVVVTVMGPSGSGKSTLLAYLCGTLDPAFTASGHARIGDEILDGMPAHRRRIGILFQDDMLFPHLSVGENLAFGLAAAVRGAAARREAVAAALTEAEMPGFADRDPATLSGGQRSRVALMRTLLAAPRALLLDEPFGKLDAALRDRIRRFVFDHARRRGLPVLLVTHDPADAAAAAGPVIALAARNGDEP
ncbi:MAG: ATP-binding cassette domain-containing protein [Alphaproteobacteria bacterium]|nr:ATP-binding cassette domain-containing protein [Alphaproteobacteria bacterium]